MRRPAGWEPWAVP
uniref:Uncharacterized protein n=1 Tax=Arundo donax TaxID=35708 RepID=A0A0A9EYH8_ARUDO